MKTKVMDTFKSMPSHETVFCSPSIYDVGKGSQDTYTYNIHDL